MLRLSLALVGLLHSGEDDDTWDVDLEDGKSYHSADAGTVGSLVEADRARMAGVAWRGQNKRGLARSPYRAGGSCCVRSGLAFRLSRGFVRARGKPETYKLWAQPGATELSATYASNLGCASLSHIRAKFRPLCYLTHQGRLLVPFYHSSLPFLI